jgi:peptidoglycan/LPS O-acetylase OafA/YrhL
MRVSSVDGFRGLAVLWIVLGHCWNELGGRVPLDGGPIRDVFISSYMGVDMLFIVSGFVLFLPVVIQGTIGDLKSYATRRAARIVPAFYAFLVFSYVISIALHKHKLGPVGWPTHLLFLHAESHPVDDLGFGVNGAMWTMSAEVMFYFTLPFVAAWYRRRPFIGLAVALSGAWFWHVLVVNLPLLLHTSGISWVGTADAQTRMALAFPSYLVHFAAGMTAAWLYVRISRRLAVAPSRVVALQVAAFIGALAVAYLRGWQGIRGTSGPFDHWVKTADRALLFAILILATVLAPKIAQWPVRNTASRLLGVTSYGIYLVHQPLVKLLIPALRLHKGTTSNFDLLLLASAAVPISVFVGIASFALFEQPFRRWARRVGSRPPMSSAGNGVPERAVALAGARS